MKENGPYHRLGEPGGPPCALGVLDITAKDRSGATFTAQLLDAGKNSTEVEMLRTIVSRFGIQWGHDEFGWWAVQRGRDFPSWAVWHQDDSGNSSMVAVNLTESQAKAQVTHFESLGHKQTYYCKDAKIT